MSCSVSVPGEKRPEVPVSCMNEPSAALQTRRRRPSLGVGDRGRLGQNSLES